jgi:hypothetical protein
MTGSFGGVVYLVFAKGLAGIKKTCNPIKFPYRSKKNVLPAPAEDWR